MRLIATCLALASCSSHAPPTVASPAPRPVAPTPVIATPATVSSQPTVLSDDEKRRDAAREPLAASIVDAYQNWNGFFSQLVASWSPDGKTFLYGSTRAGVAEIYVGDPQHPEAQPRVITSGPQRALDATYTRDGKWILYTRDHDGDENHAIWRIAADGTNATNLTPAEQLHRGLPMLPRKLPGVMFYDATTPSEAAVRVYRQDIAGGAPKLVFKSPLPGGLSDVTNDGKRALISEWHSQSDIVTIEVDLETGKTHRVFPAEGVQKGAYGITYTPDGRSVLYATDDKDRVVLLELDPATGKERRRFQLDDLPYAYLAAAPSPAGDRIALAIDAGNHGEVRILDTRTLKVQRKVEVPLGEVHVGAWRDDSRVFSILISKPDQPADVFAVDAATGAVTPLRKDVRPSLTTDAAIRAGFVREFGDVDKDAELLERFSPMRDIDKISHPLFVYNGATDPRVPYAQAEAIVKALRTRGIPVEYMLAMNEGHPVDHRDTKIELLTRTARFLEDALR
jgi:dipeptidyl aminopeptidase/acylaminoacyl peptidase